MSDEDLDYMQRQVNEWAQRFKDPSFPPFRQGTCLMQEAGEVGKELENIHGKGKEITDEGREKLGRELADVIFTAVCIANSHGIPLKGAWNEMVETKLYKRDVDRFERRETK